MATKKAAVSPQNKMLTTAVKKTINSNTVVPILEDILFGPGYARVSDLETDVQIPYKLDGLGKSTVCIPAKMFLETAEMLPNMKATVDKNFGVEMQDGPRKAKLMGENPDNFPLEKMYTEKTVTVGTLTEADLALLADAMSFVSDDDLRPAMTGVYFEAPVSGKESRIVSTDAHRLFWHGMEGSLKETFILPQKTAKILLAFGGGPWEVHKPADKSGEYIRLAFFREDGLKIAFRPIDAKFPDYRVVVPQGDGFVSLEADPEFMLKELKNAGKYANRSTNQVCIGMNGKLTFSSQDVDFSFEYNSVFDNGDGGEFKFLKDFPTRYSLDGKELLHVTKVNKDKINYMWQGAEFSVEKSKLVELPKELTIAFNQKFLSEVIHKLPKGETVKFKFWTPTKATIINDYYLIMPLMMNQ